MNEVEINGIKYQLKRMTPEMVGDFTRLFNYTKNQNVPPTFFLKKYSNTPASPFYFGFLLYDNAIPVAHCGVIPFNVNVNGNKIIVGNGTETVTHPDYQRRGLYKFLTNHLVEFCREQGLEFIYRFSNANSGVIAKEKFNWVCSDNFNCTRIEVKAFPLFKLFAKFKLHAFYEKWFLWVSRLYTGDNKKFLSQYALDGKMMVERSEAFLNYKNYTCNSLIAFENNGLFAWVKTEDGLLVGDFFPQDEDSFLKLLRYLKQFAFLAGLHNIKIVLSEKHPSFQYVKNYGKNTRLNPVLIKDLTGNKLYEKMIFTGADRNIF
jgi:GNAT superfamily N-acetyltransferase